MHKFNLPPIKITHINHCNGCPCIRGSNDFESGIYCAAYGEEITHHVQTFPEIKHTGLFNRLDICKQNDKEKKSNVV